MPIVPPLRPGYTPNRNGTSLSGASPVAVFQNANAPSKPGRSPPERRSTACDHCSPCAVNAGGAPVFTPSTGWIAATVGGEGGRKSGGGFSGNCKGTGESGGAVTRGSRK